MLSFLPLPPPTANLKCSESHWTRTHSGEAGWLGEESDPGLPEASPNQDASPRPPLHRRHHASSLQLCRQHRGRPQPLLMQGSPITCQLLSLPMTVIPLQTQPPKIRWGKCFSERESGSMPQQGHVGAPFAILEPSCLLEGMGVWSQRNSCVGRSSNPKL